MLIRVFKRSYLVQYALLLLLATILWLPALIHPPITEVADNGYTSPAWYWISYFANQYPHAGTVAAFILMLAGALFINAILEKYDLVAKNTLVPAFIYILILSHQPENLHLYQTLIPNFLVLVVLFYLFDIYIQQEAYAQVFNAGFIAGIATLFYMPAAVFFLFIWLTFFVYRLYAWREWVIATIGFLLVFFFLGAYYFLTDQLAIALSSLNAYFSSILFFHLNFDSTIFTAIISIILLLFFLHCLFLLIVHLQENVISVRKRYVSVFWYLILSVLMIFFVPDNLSESSGFFFTGSIIILSWAVLRSNRIKWYEWITAIIILLVLINTYYSLLINPMINA